MTEKRVSLAERWKSRVVTVMRFRKYVVKLLEIVENRCFCEYPNRTTYIPGDANVQHLSRY